MTWHVDLLNQVGLQGPHGDDEGPHGDESSDRYLYTSQFTYRPVLWITFGNLSLVCTPLPGRFHYQSKHCVYPLRRGDWWWWCETGKVTTTMSENGCVATWLGWGSGLFAVVIAWPIFWRGSTWKACDLLRMPISESRQWDTPMDDNLHGDKSRHLLDL